MLVWRDAVNFISQQMSLYFRHPSAGTIHVSNPFSVFSAEFILPSIHIDVKVLFRVIQTDTIQEVDTSIIQNILCYI